jgi:hypothetical protein
MENRERSGERTLLNIARALCRAVTFFSPFLRRKYANNEAVLNAIALCESVCAILPVLEDIQSVGGFNDPIVQDPSSTPGINPNAPAAPVSD